MLVSIIVITYNSEQFILETLESIKQQSYKELELIITDDCSKDDTINKCKRWLDKNFERFKSVKIITSKINTGVSANLNRGCQVANGEWLKIIAGDDILLEDCIFSNIKYIANNQKANFIFSKAETFQGDSRILPVSKKIKYYNLEAKKQYEKLILGNFVIAPTSFIRKIALDKYKNFDEDIKLIEDLAMWLKITAQGEKLYFLDKITVKYRIHEKSISSNTKNLIYVSDLNRIKNKYVFKGNFLLKYHFNLIIKMNFFQNKLFKLLSPLYIKEKLAEFFEKEEL